MAPRPLALHDVQVEGREGAWTILTSKGRIDAVQPASEDVPARYRLLDGAGLHVTGAFLDASAHAGFAERSLEVDQDVPVDTGKGIRIAMRTANRKGIQPSWRAAEHLAIAEGDPKKWTSAGFAGWVVAPEGELLSGSSCLVVARDLAAREQVVVADTFQHAAFRASGGGYPSTLMGYLAQLRQFFLDAQHHRQEQLWAARGEGGRPAFDPDLEAAWSLLDGEAHLVCQAESARDIHRWLNLGDEFGLRIAILGGREAYKLAGRLAETKTPVILTLDWPEEAKDPREKDEPRKGKGPRGKSDAEAEGDEGESESADEPEANAPESPNWDYEEPFGVRLDKRLRWEELRDCALRLSEAGVPVAFGSGGEGPSSLLEHLTELVEAGYSRTAALEALGAGAAKLLGAERFLGGLQEGAPANLVAWTAAALTKDAKVRFSIVEGHLTEFDAEAASNEAPAEGANLTGTWTVKDPGDAEDDPMTLVLEMEEDGRVTGSLTAVNPMDGSAITGDIEGSLRGTNVQLRSTLDVGGMSVKMTMKGEWADGAFSGTTTIDLGGQQEELKFEATRNPAQRAQ